MDNTVGSLNKSLFLISLRPYLILCKCLGLCSISNMFTSFHAGELYCKVFSLGTVYEVLFILIGEIYVTGGVKSIPHLKTLNIVGLLALFYLLIFLFCRISDSKMLELLKNTDDADLQIIRLYSTYEKLCSVDYKWLAFIIVYSGYVYFDFTCEWIFKKCANVTSLFTLVYQLLPFLLMISLFCSISYELQKRFTIMKTLMKQNLLIVSDAFLFEEYRIAHCKLVSSAELFCECFSIKITSQLLILTMQVVTFTFFPCFHGTGCNPYFTLLHFLHQCILYCVICFCASGLNEKNQDLLDELNMMALNESPYKIKDQIDLFSCQVALCPLKFSAFGFFDVDLTTLFAILSVILMYTVIVAQLADRLQPYMVGLLG